MLSITVNILTITGQPLRVQIDEQHVAVMPTDSQEPYVELPATEAQKLMKGLEDVYNNKP